jgi:hypothetical protein
VRSVARDMGTPNLSPMGHGWLLVRFGNTNVLSFSGASPGGVAVLVGVPDHDLVFAAFGNDPRTLPLHDKLLLWLLREHLHIEVPDLLQHATPVGDLTPYAGTYASNQLRVEVSVVHGQLEETLRYEPQDASQARIFREFSGGAVEASPRRFVPIREALFAPAGMPLQAFNGYSRILMISYHGFSNGRWKYRCAGGRMTRRQDDALA